MRNNINTFVLKLCLAFCLVVLASGCASTPNPKKAEVSWWQFLNTEKRGGYTRCNLNGDQSLSVLIGLLEEGDKVSAYIDTYRDANQVGLPLKRSPRESSVKHGAFLYEGEKIPGGYRFAFEDKRLKNAAYTFLARNGTQIDLLRSERDGEMTANIYRKKCKPEKGIKAVVRRVDWTNESLEPPKLHIAAFEEGRFPTSTMKSLHHFNLIATKNAKVKAFYEDISEKIAHLDRLSPLSIIEAKRIASSAFERHNDESVAKTKAQYRGKIYDEDIENLEQAIFEHWWNKLDVEAYSAKSDDIQTLIKKASQLKSQFSNALAKRERKRKFYAQEQRDHAQLVRKLERGYHASFWPVAKRYIQGEIDKAHKYNGMDEAVKLNKALKRFNYWLDKNALLLDGHSAAEYKTLRHEIKARIQNLDAWILEKLPRWLDKSVASSSEGMKTLHEVSQALFGIRLQHVSVNGKNDVAAVLKAKELEIRINLCKALPGFEYYKRYVCES